MKSFSDDLPNVTKEEFARSTAISQEAADVSKATLAAVDENHKSTKKLLSYMMAVIVINVVLTGTALGVLARHFLG